MALLSLLLAAAVNGQSALDGFDPNANGTIRVAVVQPDGKILLGGDFTALSPNGGVAVTRNHIARLNPDGTLDMAFDPNANNIVWSIAVQADGRILVGGFFHGANSIGGQPRNYIARLDATNGLADSFNPGADNNVRLVMVQPDGRILVGGDFFSIGGQSRHHIARLDPATGLADSFDSDANGDVYSIARQADGKILAGGFFTSIGGQTRHGIARLDATSGLADWFDPSGASSSTIFSVAVQADGKILVGGGFTSMGGQARNRIARLDAMTGLADSFDPNANSTVASIAVQADGKILAAGSFAGIGGAARNKIARLDATTGLADSLNSDANGFIVYSIAVQADGKILAGGDFTALASNGGAPVTRNGIARLETDGRLDQNFDPGVNAQIITLAVQPDGKIVVGGEFTTIGGGGTGSIARNRIARLNPDGTVDMSFDPGANDLVVDLLVQPDGKILVGGNFVRLGGGGTGTTTRNKIGRLNPDGTIDTSFNPGANAFVNNMALQADGKIVAGGYFTRLGGGGTGTFTRNHVGRLNADGTIDTGFDPGANDVVYALSVKPDGKILIGGRFTTLGGGSTGTTPRNFIGRLNADGTLDSGFDPGTNDRVIAMALQADGKILAGGSFSLIGGGGSGTHACANMARLNQDGTVDTSFTGGADGTVTALVVQADGKIVAGGYFTSLGNGVTGATRMHIGRLNADSTLDSSFDPGSGGAGEFINALVIQGDGKVIVCGSFTTLGGGGSGTSPRNYVGRLTNTTAALQQLSVEYNGASITWQRGGASPEVERVAFELSSDGINYSPLGNPVRIAGGWQLTDQSLPMSQDVFVRARGFYHSAGFGLAPGSIVETVRKTFVSPTSAQTILGNISTRLRVETDDNVLIGGFIVTGTQPKRVIVRAIGPSLPFAGALSNPILELRDSSGGLIRSNDNWRSDQESEIIATTIPPSNDLESAIVETLPANGSAYTAIVRGVDNGTGVGLIEAYDLDPTVNSKLANISTRGLVQTGNDVMIAGTIVLGQASQRVLVRALGPSLPVQGNLADPTLELRDGNGTLIRANDNWRSDQESEIVATTIPPSDDLESAIVETLPANGAAYTAIVSGMGGGTGVAIVEVYALN